MRGFDDIIEVKGHAIIFAGPFSSGASLSLTTSILAVLLRGHQFDRFIRRAGFSFMGLDMLKLKILGITGA